MRVLLDHGEGVVVDRNHGLWVHKLDRFECVVRTHGEVVADGEDGQVNAVPADQGHVPKETGVSSVVE